MTAVLSARWRAIVLSSVATLLVIVFGWQCAGGLTGTALLRGTIFSVPILLPLHGLVLGHRYTYRWATLCVLPYFIVAITESFANPAERFWAAAMLAAALIWFFALVAYLRVTGLRATTADAG